MRDYTAYDTGDLVTEVHLKGDELVLQDSIRRAASETYSNIIQDI